MNKINKGDSFSNTFRKLAPPKLPPRVKVPTSLFEGHPSEYGLLKGEKTPEPDSLSKEDIARRTGVDWNNPEWIISSIKKDGKSFAFQKVPTDVMTPEIANLAVGTDPFWIKYLRKDLITKNLCNIATQKYPELADFCNEFMVESVIVDSDKEESVEDLEESSTSPKGVAADYMETLIKAKSFDVPKFGTVTDIKKVLSMPGMIVASGKVNNMYCNFATDKIGNDLYLTIQCDDDSEDTFSVKDIVVDGLSGEEREETEVLPLKEDTGMNGYIAFYKGKRYELYANSKYEAQKKAAEFFKAKKSYEVNVELAEVNEKDITHIATEAVIPEKTNKLADRYKK
jgi:hypothetical protein